MSFSNTSNSYKMQNNSFYNGIYVTATEAFQIGSASLIVHQFAIIIFSNAPSFNETYQMIVTGVIVEELLYRTVLQGGIKNIQYYSFKWIRGREATNDELESQKTFRVWTVCIVSTLAKAATLQSTLSRKIIQIGAAVFGQLSLSYLKESTESTGATILWHSFTNLTITCGIAGVISPVASIAFVISSNITVYLFASKGIQGIKNDIASILSSELVKITLASYAIHKIAIHVFVSLPDLFDQAYGAVVTASIWEELFFRTLLQGGIKNIQYYTFKWIRGRDASKEELESQKTFRVWTTGILFGLVHASNPHSNLLDKVIQVASCTFGGVTYGYLKEKTGTTSVTILCHSANNFTVMCGMAGFISPPFALTAILTAEISLYLFASK